MEVAGNTTGDHETNQNGNTVPAILQQQPFVTMEQNNDFYIANDTNQTKDYVLPGQTLGAVLSSGAVVQLVEVPIAAETWTTISTSPSNDSNDSYIIQQNQQQINGTVTQCTSSFQAYTHSPSDTLSQTSYDSICTPDPYISSSYPEETAETIMANINPLFNELDEINIDDIDTADLFNMESQEAVVEPQMSIKTNLPPPLSKSLNTGGFLVAQSLEHQSWKKDAVPIYPNTPEKTSCKEYFYLWKYNSKVFIHF